MVRLNLSDGQLWVKTLLIILILLVHEISFPQKKYTNKFVTSAIPKRCQIVTIMPFSTRSCDR